MSRPELPSGICDFETVWVVTTYTSGNELRGKPEHFGEYASEMDARQALADDGFTNGQWGWRKGYSDAEISRRIKYFNHRPATDDARISAAVKAALEEAAEAALLYDTGEGAYDAIRALADDPAFMVRIVKGS